MKRLAAALMVVLAACAASPNARPKVKARVTTTTASTTSTTVASTTTSTSVVLARPCSADDLGIDSTQTSGQGGHEGLSLSLLNVSTTACALSGYPTAFNATTPDGHPLTTFTKGTYFPDPEPGNVEPRSGNGLFIIETSNVCLDASGAPPATDYKNIRIGMPGGGTLSLGDLTVNGTCGIAVSKFGVSAP